MKLVMGYFTPVSRNANLEELRIYLQAIAQVLGRALRKRLGLRNKAKTQARYIIRS